jgi:RimJ/RimL family protein N-acetyltransferase
MEIEVIPYKKEHAYLIYENIRERDAGISSDIDELSAAWERQGPAYTVIIDGELVFCGGFILMGWNRAEAWTLMSDLFYKYPKACFKICRDYTNKVINEYGLKRVQAIIDVDFEAGVRFAERLGYEEEGRLKAYGPDGEDMLMFGRRI